MRDYDTIINKLMDAYQATKSKVGSWQKDVLVIILEALIGLYEEKRLEEYKKFE